MILITWLIKKLKNFSIVRVKFLLDTQLLLEAAGLPQQLSSSATTLINNPLNQMFFSSASLWEITIKNSLGRKDFQVDPRLLLRGLLDNGYLEIPITSQHTIFVDTLPPIHKDPFDRILVAQANIEGIILATKDISILKYPGSIQKI